ncbi:MAG: DoxX family protein [Burkholderiaceae bacterium]|nr:DoxX family protein [Burkholderiaceae bacterium]
MDALQKYLPLLGRICIAWLFVPAGWGKLVGFSGTVGYAASAGLPFPPVMVVIAIAIELVAGLALLAGYQARWAAALLALFTIVAAFGFHNYWTMPPEKQGMQKINFDKNVAIFGGLLFVVAFGAGRFSIDERRHAAAPRSVPAGR